MTLPKRTALSPSGSSVCTVLGTWKVFGNDGCSCRGNKSTFLLRRGRGRLLHVLFAFLSLADLEVFIRNTESGMLKKVEKGDFRGLVEIMGHLMALKERQNSTDEMFEPLKHTIELLKTYEQELPETVFKQLEVSAQFVS